MLVEVVFDYNRCKYATAAFRQIPIWILFCFRKQLIEMADKPCCGLPFCARIRVQCSDMFMMTRGCSETVTEGTVARLAITQSVDSSVGGVLAGWFDVDGVAFISELLVEASPKLLSLSTSIFSFVAVTGIISRFNFFLFIWRYSQKCELQIIRANGRLRMCKLRFRDCYFKLDLLLACAFVRRYENHCQNEPP